MAVAKEQKPRGANKGKSASSSRLKKSNQEKESAGSEHVDNKVACQIAHEDPPRKAARVSRFSETPPAQTVCPAVEPPPVVMSAPKAERSEGAFPVHGAGSRAQSAPSRCVTQGIGSSLSARDVRISKASTQVLRHTAMQNGIQIRSDGFCLVGDLMAVGVLKSLGCTLDDLQRIVSSNDKQRFELREEQGVHMIRAVQGHSMKEVEDNSLLRPLTLTDTDLPAVCVHGTYRRHLDSIFRQGLIPGGGRIQRNHVHFSCCEPGDGRVISGMRTNCEVAIWINLPLAMSEGVPFFMSTNKVILSAGLNGTIDTKYFSKVKDLQAGEIDPSLWAGALANRPLHPPQGSAIGPSLLPAPASFGPTGAVQSWASGSMLPLQDGTSPAVRGPVPSPFPLYQNPGGVAPWALMALMQQHHRLTSSH